ncbi:Uncharacterised protein [uncultured archaeon]|nr:Uncharacterised protein [uncultured archaeon]
MDAENTCNGGKANGSHLDNGRVNEFQSAFSIGSVHDPRMNNNIFKNRKYILLLGAMYD